MTMTNLPILTRRDFVFGGILAVGAPAALILGRILKRRAVMSVPTDVTIVEFTDDGVRGKVVRVPKLMKSDEAWRAQLSEIAFDVARRGGTERPFSGAYWNEHRKGLFRCICCDTALFSSAAKFDSGTGWPSYWEPIAQENVRHGAPSSGFTASEVTCTRCDAHLGDLFDDGPRPTGLRYCIDSVSLRFAKSAR